VRGVILISSSLAKGIEGAESNVGQKNFSLHSPSPFHSALEVTDCAINVRGGGSGGGGGGGEANWNSSPATATLFGTFRRAFARQSSAVWVKCVCYVFVL